MVKLAAMAEMWLGKPVIAINTATYWHALRTRGIMDKVEGCGKLAGTVLRRLGRRGIAARTPASIGFQAAIRRGPPARGPK